MDYLQTELGKWSDGQFGYNRKPHSSIEHLKKEVDELLEKPYSVEEYGDCLMLLLDAARRAGITGSALMEQAYKKLEINKKREWGKPDDKGIVEHKKS